MPGEGFFYTYLTNFSDNLVTFDNLTIRHKQGTLRNIHEYYPYGLEYWRSGTKLYDRGDQFSEFHHREWELDGIEMNRFAARLYDAIPQFTTAAQRRFRNANPSIVGAIERWHCLSRCNR